MTPAARVAAAITILDDIFDGRVAEQALTNWARSSRFAGSGDRAAVRDLVFDGLRAKLTLAASSGASSGRGVMIGLGLRDGWNMGEIFSGQGHAPDPMTSGEGNARSPADWEKANIAKWLWPQWESSLGENAMATAQALQARAPVFLRVNLRRGSRAAAQNALQTEGIATAAHPTVATCLEVLENPRRVKTSAAFALGLIEVQDASSQAAVAQLGLPKGARVLDYCAGGGGKALALADIYDAVVTAHDISTARMRDIPVRAERAGVSVEIADHAQLKRLPEWDFIVIDAPCSGSGTWRRTPDAKWRLTPEDLFDFNKLQGEVLVNAAGLSAPSATLAYMTCSVLQTENADVINKFVADNPLWQVKDAIQRLPGPDGDGFFLSVLHRSV